MLATVNRFQDLPLPSSVVRSDVGVAAVECTAKLEAVSKCSRFYRRMSRAIARNVAAARCVSRMEIPEECSGREALHFDSIIVRISTQQEVTEWGGVDS